MNPDEAADMAFADYLLDSKEERIRVLEADCEALRKALAEAEAPKEQSEAEKWENLYRKAIDVANGLTNYVEDRPELRRMEKELAAIQQEARDIVARGGKK